MTMFDAEGRIREASYAESYRNRILPFWKEGSETILKAAEGLRLYTWHRMHPNPRARIFISHGYAESTLKYRESFHEIWNERDMIRNPYLDDVLSFYQRWEKR
jgi:lysophospholipase